MNIKPKVAIKKKKQRYCLKRNKNYKEQVPFIKLYPFLINYRCNQEISLNTCL